MYSHFLLLMFNAWLMERGYFQKVMVAGWKLPVTFFRWCVVAVGEYDTEVCILCRCSQGYAFFRPCAIRRPFAK